MFPLESGVYVALGTILGSLITGGFVMINNYLQLKREREQRIWQEESDRQKWYREKIYESYKVSIQILKKSMQEKSSNKHHEDSCESNTNLTDLNIEFMSEFMLAIIGHPYKNNDEIQELIKEILDIALEDPFSARGLITKMMEEDPRINAVNKGYLNSQNSSTTHIS